MPQPRIDRRRCEGKGVCAAVCPHGVISIRRFDSTELAGLGTLGKLRAWVHGNKQADVAHPGLCQGCGLCVQRCPEQAIHLVPGAHEASSGTPSLTWSADT